MPDVASDWEKWMEQQHIPDVLDTKMFKWARFSKLLTLDTDDGITYSVQYCCKSMKDIHTYQAHFAQKLQQEHNEKFKDKFVAFRSIMEEVLFFEK